MSPPIEEHDYIGLSEVSSNGSCSTISSETLKTELRLGLPGSDSPDRVNGPGLTLGMNVKGFGSGSGSKRGFNDTTNGSNKWGFSGSEVELFSPRQRENVAGKDSEKKTPSSKAQVVGWPPLRNSRKNIMANNSNHAKDKEDADGKQGPGCLYIKVSMDGAPYLRKIDLKTYKNYKELSLALEKMFSCFTIGQCGSKSELIEGSENVLTYEDKDGDWMLVGDVPWEMFTETCRRLRIMKGSDAIGLAPRATEKSKNHK